MKQYGNADPREFMLALQGLDYPTSRAGVLQRARDTGGLDAEVAFVLERLPDRTFESVHDLQGAIEEAYGRSGAYARSGGLEGAGPASPATRDEKRGASIEADTRTPTE